jgi:signal recognition particle subunit SRP54
VLEGVTPQVQFVKVVSDELVELMGSEGSKDLNPGQPQVILMAGLQVWRQPGVLGFAGFCGCT